MPIPILPLTLEPPHAAAAPAEQAAYCDHLHSYCDSQARLALEYGEPTFVHWRRAARIAAIAARLWREQSP